MSKNVVTLKSGLVPKDPAPIPEPLFFASPNRLRLATPELVMGHFFKTQSNPTQTFWTQPNPTHKSFHSTNPTHHRHLWHIRLYRKLYTTTVTRHRQVHSQWQLLFSCSTHSQTIEYFMKLKISRSQVSTQPNPTQPMDGRNPWPTLGDTTVTMSTIRIYILCPKSDD